MEHPIDDDDDFIDPPDLDADQHGDGDDPAGSTRRGLLGLLTVVLGAVPILGGLYMTMRAGLAPAKDNRPQRVPLCKLGEVPDDGIKQVTISYLTRRGAKVESVGKVVFVTRDPATREILALAGECTHLACPVQNRELTLKAGGKAPLTCPCHGGMFSRTGEVLEGPPRRRLDQLTLDTLPQQADDTIYLVGF